MKTLGATRYFRPIAAAMAVVLTLTSCVTSGTNMVPTTTARELGERGAILLNFGRAAGLTARAFELEINPVDPATGKPHPRTPDEGPETALAVTKPWRNTAALDGFAAFELPAGKYVITRIAEISAGGKGGAAGTAYSPYQGGAGQGGGIAALVVLGAAALVLGGMAVAETIEQKQKEKLQLPNVNRGEFSFVADGAVQENAPVFTVKPGRVTYIGDIKLESDWRTGLKLVDPDADPETQTITHRTIHDAKVSAIYSIDREGAKAYLPDVGLVGAPMDTVDLARYFENPVNIWDFKYPAKPED